MRKKCVHFSISSLLYLALALDRLDQRNALANLGILSRLGNDKILLATLDHRARVDLVACSS